MSFFYVCFLICGCSSVDFVSQIRKVPEGEEQYICTVLHIHAKKASLKNPC